MNLAAWTLPSLARASILSAMSSRSLMLTRLRKAWRILATSREGVAGAAGIALGEAAVFVAAIGGRPGVIGERRGVSPTCRVRFRMTLPVRGGGGTLRPGRAVARGFGPLTPGPSPGGRGQVAVGGDLVGDGGLAGGELFAETMLVHGRNLVKRAEGTGRPRGAGAAAGFLQRNMGLKKD